jgi:uncharacterized protein HemY
VAWHDQEATVCESRRYWFGAVFHLGYFIKGYDGNPALWSYYARRGHAQAWRGLLRQAAEDYRQASESSAFSATAAYEQAAIRLLAGDRKEYFRASHRMIDRLAKSTDPQVLYLAARAHALAPRPLPFALAALPLAQKAVAGQPNSPQPLHTLALAHYRAGQFQQAILSLEKCLALTSGSPPELSWLLLGMAHARLGADQVAQRWISKATLSIDRQQPQEQWHLHDWLAWQLLRREAEALLRR